MTTTKALANGTQIEITERKGFSGKVKFYWNCPANGAIGQGAYRTEDEAFANAEKILGDGGRECRHGVLIGQFCHTCNDQEM